MSDLINRLRETGQANQGTDLGGLMQWAALHIESQDEALAELRQAHADEMAERIRLQQALHDAKAAVEGALAVIGQPLCPPIEFSRDFAPHINLMAGHGDPDYLTRAGLSIRHVDCREPKPTRSKKAKTP